MYVKNGGTACVAAGGCLDVRGQPVERQARPAFGVRPGGLMSGGEQADGDLGNAGRGIAVKMRRRQRESGEAGRQPPAFPSCGHAYEPQTGTGPDPRRSQFAPPPTEAQLRTALQSGDAWEPLEVGVLVRFDDVLAARVLLGAEKED